MLITRRLSKHKRLASQRRRSALFALVGVVLVANARSPETKTFELRVITGESDELTQRILRALRNRHPELASNRDPRALATRKGDAVYLAIGPAALQAALEAEVGGPLLCLFTSNETYTRLIASRPRRGKLALVTAIFAEPAPDHQMKLIRALYRRRVSVGVFLTSSTSHLKPLLLRAARVSDLDLQVRILAPGTNVVRALSQIQSAKVLLVVPDRDLFSAGTFRNLLVATHRSNQAVIGFSAASVPAGTLGAPYCTIEDTVAQVGALASELAAGRKVLPRYSRYWRVAINENVARSLNIPIDDSIHELGNPAP